MGDRIPPGAGPGGVREVKSAARTIAVLELLAERSNEPVSIREICAAMNAPRSSIYALLRTLTEAGWVRTDSTRSLYSIGIRALLAGTTYLDTDPLLQVVRPHLALLGKQVRGNVNYGRLDGRHIVYLATWEAPGRERAVARVGRRLPAHATALGQAVLAGLDPVQRAAHLGPELAALTPATITSRTALEKELADVRRRGYALEREQNSPGIACLAVAIRGAGTLDALSVSLPLAELTPAREREVAEALRDTASVTEDVMAGLGGLLA
ncbi:IclR family transcriptional regulator [Arthrobacter mobilis]|uniref:Glycerol operon regulatory protein n=1 Tax=Arthrobacter mobilis TaxID=2724944 RepID=A0A7X6K7Y0_9MICC|nr:IclR family transcriptional regulator [Arthrobacter mobilis]NKX56802.1 IclR family transcriptional regulator [Arthrobacter mobilis]